MSKRTPRGRGAPVNPAGRFEKLDFESLEPVPAKVPTQFLRDSSRTVIARNASPDVGFDASVNPYRGCEHGCANCYARPTHEYLGFSAGLGCTGEAPSCRLPRLAAREATRWRCSRPSLHSSPTPYCASVCT